MEAVQIEVQSFVDKFSHLTSLGYNTNIHFKRYHGRMFVNFEAELGVFNQLPTPLTHTLVSHHQQQQLKPSKARRISRRGEARHQLDENNQNENKISNVAATNLGLDSGCNSDKNDKCTEVVYNGKSSSSTALDTVVHSSTDEKANSDSTIDNSFVVCSSSPSLHETILIF